MDVAWQPARGLAQLTTSANIIIHFETDPVCPHKPLVFTISSHHIATKHPRQSDSIGGAKGYNMQTLACCHKAFAQVGIERGFLYLLAL